MDVVSVGTYDGRAVLLTLTPEGQLEPLGGLNDSLGAPLTNLTLHQRPASKAPGLPPSSLVRLVCSGNLSRPNFGVTTWDAQTSEGLLYLKLANYQKLLPDLSPDGQRICIGTDDGLILMKSQVGGDFVAVKRKAAYTDCKYSPDGRFVLLVGQYLPAALITLKDYSADEEEEMQIADIGDGKARAWGCAFSPDGTKLAVALSSSRIKVWSVTGDLICDIKTPFVPLFCSFNPQGDSILASGSLSDPQAWDLKTGEKTTGYVTEHVESRNVSEYLAQGYYSSDGTKVVTVTSLHDVSTVIVWEAKTGKKLSSWSTSNRCPISSLHLTRIRPVTDWERARLVLLGYLKGGDTNCPFATTPSLVIQHLLSYCIRMPLEKKDEDVDTGPLNKKSKTSIHFKKSLTITKEADDEDEDEDEDLYDNTDSDSDIDEDE